MGVRDGKIKHMFRSSADRDARKSYENLLDGGFDQIPKAAAERDQATLCRTATEGPIGNCS
jgi:hypothetical protein